jgi:hypothetical protein
VVFNTHPSSLQPCCLIAEIAYMTRRSDEVTMYFPASHSVFFFDNGHSVFFIMVIQNQEVQIMCKIKRYGRNRERLVSQKNDSVYQLHLQGQYFLLREREGVREERERHTECRTWGREGDREKERDRPRDRWRERGTERERGRKREWERGKRGREGQTETERENSLVIDSFWDTFLG